MTIEITVEPWWSTSALSKPQYLFFCQFSRLFHVCVICVMFPWRCVIKMLQWECEFLITYFISIQKLRFTLYTPSLDLWHLYTNFVNTSLKHYICSEIHNCLHFECWRTILSNRIVPVVALHYRSLTVIEYCSSELDSHFFSHKSLSINDDINLFVSETVKRSNNSEKV